MEVREKMPEVLCDHTGREEERVIYAICRAVIPTVISDIVGGRVTKLSYLCPDFPLVYRSCFSCCAGSFYVKQVVVLFLLGSFMS